MADFFFIDLFDEVLLLKAEPHQEQQYLVQHFLTKQQKWQITQNIALMKYIPAGDLWKL